MTKKTSVKNKKCGITCRANVNYSKSPKVYKQGNLRYVKINDRKHYFVSDLVAKHGRGFVNLMENEPLKLRIKDNNNSQERRLVSATEARALKLV